MLNIGQLNMETGMNIHTLQKLAWQTVNLPIEVMNAFANWHIAFAFQNPQVADAMIKIMEMAKEHPHRIKDMTEIPRGKGPALIVGSGSSLNFVMDRIKEWKGAIFCSSSQASTFAKVGRCPDYMIVLDPREAPQDELAAEDWGYTKLLGHVSMPTGYMTKWLKRAKGDIYLGRLMEPTYDWYSHHLGDAYPWIKHVMLPSIDTGAGEIGLATWMGYSPLYFAGIDYGGPRFNRWDWHYDTKEWTLDADTSAYDVKDHDASGIVAMSYSSRGSLMSAYMQIANRKYCQRIYQLSDRTVLRQFPYVAWDNLVSGAFKEPKWDERVDETGSLRERVMEDIECALAAWDTFLIPIEGGWDGPDYMIYLAREEMNFSNAMQAYNIQQEINIKNFSVLEKQHGKTITELLIAGIAHVEAGELLLHRPEEFGEWDWHKMRGIDIPAVLMRRRYLLAEAKKRGYTRAGEEDAMEKVMVQSSISGEGPG